MKRPPKISAISPESAKSTYRMPQQMAPGAVHQFNLDDHLILFKEGTDRVQVLDPMARYIWNATQAGLNSDAVAAEIAQQFGISPQAALRDVDNVINQWTSGLLAEPRAQQQRPSHNLPRELYTHWQPETEATFRFPRFSVRVRYDSKEIADLITPILGYLAISDTADTDHVIDILPHDSGDGGYLIIDDDKVVETADSPMDAAVMAFRGITELACGRENWLAILHAGGVAWKGQGIIFPSSGGAGKTTLTAALTHHGFDYLNDDVIPLERGTGKLIPIPMSLCIKSGSWTLLQPFYPELERLKIFGRNNLRVKYLPPPTQSSTANSYPAQHLIIPKRQEGADPVLKKISPAKGLQAIVEGESLLSHPLGSAEVKELTEWVGRLHCYRLIYDKLEPAVQTILKHVN